MVTAQIFNSSPLFNNIKFEPLIWLCLLITITIVVTYFYESYKKSQYDYLKKTLNNVFFLKTFTKITSELEDRFIELDYTVKAGDTYESIINDINILMIT